MNPKVGAIVVFSAPGHVAYVESLGDNGSFNVSEMDAYRSAGFTVGVNYATYYKGSGNTYHRNINRGTDVQGSWTLKGFIYRRDYGANLYCDDINSAWGICWTPSSTDVSCKGGKDWTLYDFEQGSTIRVSTNKYCLEPGGIGGGTPTDPEPTDPDYDLDIHINSLDIRLLGGSYAKEIQKILYWGQSFQFEGRAEYENKSSQDAEDIDADYRITDSRSNFNENATKIDEDGLFDIDSGEREENSINPITVTVSADGTKVSYSQGSMTRSFDVINGFSKVYIFADVEVDGDKDISSPSDHDEYGKIELIILEPNHLPIGWLDSVNCTQAQGWAKDPNTESPIDIHIYSKNQGSSTEVHRGTVSASTYRGDVGSHGFSWTIPTTLKTGAPYTLNFYAIDSAGGPNPLIGQSQLLCAAPVNNLYPAYRAFNPTMRSHFYTTGEAEKNKLHSLGWLLEGIAFYAHSVREPNTFPVYRFFQNGRGHFYTISEAEKNNLVVNYSWLYRLEGIAFYAYSWQVFGTSPVYRLYSHSEQNHFYTASQVERNYAVSYYGHVYEGIAFYAHLSPPN